MRRLVGRLGQKQTATGGSGKNSSPPPFLDDILVILLRFESEQGKPESVLTARLPMTPPSVASVLGEKRGNLVGEIDPLDLARLGGFNLNRTFQVAGGMNGHGGFSVGQRFDPPVRRNLDDSSR